MKRSIWSYYPPWSLFPVSVDDWPWSVLWLWSGLWAAQTLAERPGIAQLGTACHSWPAARADGQQPNSPISIWSGLNQMPGGELSVEWPWNDGGGGAVGAGVGSKTGHGARRVDGAGLEPVQQFWSVIVRLARLLVDWLTGTASTGWP